MLIRQEQLIDIDSVVGHSIEYDYVIQDCIMLHTIDSKIIKIRLTQDDNIVYSLITYTDIPY
jgi:hypothetical protein